MKAPEQTAVLAVFCRKAQKTAQDQALRTVTAGLLPIEGPVRKQKQQGRDDGSFLRWIFNFLLASSRIVHIYDIHPFFSFELVHLPTCSGYRKSRDRYEFLRPCDTLHESRLGTLPQENQMSCSSQDQEMVRLHVSRRMMYVQTLHHHPNAMQVKTEPTPTPIHP